LAAIKNIYNAEDIDRALVASKPSRSTFATVRLRTKVAKGPGSRAAWIAMAYTLIHAAQAHWRAVNAPHLVALVRAGAVFHKGKLLERPTDITPPQPPSDGDQHPATEVA
jgi:putative transposase